MRNPAYIKVFIQAAVLLFLAAQLPAAYAGALLFDGDFESGAFQGWTPGGQNGGFTSLAAKGTCFSANDTTAISFNGDLANNYAALLRSNTEGSPASKATLRSLNFAAGRGILFSALSETSESVASTKSVNLVVRILNSEGKALAELPLQTAVINLSEGCPSIKRDTTFSVHYIDTRPYDGEVSVEFVQSTNTPGHGFFTLIDNVVLVEKDEVFVNQTQPIAVAGTGLTSSNILFLDPRDSFDPDNLPAPLQYTWFIDGDETIRLYDLPCVNLNDDFTLEPGNHKATLYVSDTINYAADSIRFVVNSTVTTTDDSTAGDDDTSSSNITLTTPKGDPIVNDANLVSADGVTQTDPQEECNIDVASTLDDDPEEGDGTLTIDVDTSSDEVFDATFTIDGPLIDATSNNVAIESAAEDASVTSLVVTIVSPEDEDALTASVGSVTDLTVSGDGTSSITIEPDPTGTEVSDDDYITVLESVQYEYTVASADNPVTTQREITYTVTDSEGNSESDSSTVTIEE